MNVTVTTAIELSKQELSEIKKKLEKKLSAEVVLSANVDPSIVGGIALTVGSEYIDSTVRAKLTRVKTALEG